MNAIETYTIQDWLFKEAEGRFEIDLAESGIQYHYFHDLPRERNYDLNYSLDRGKHEMRAFIARMYNVGLENVMITHGSQEALYLFYRCFLCRGDHIITFAPGWQQAWEVPRVIGAQVSCLQLRAHDQFRIDFNTLKQTVKNNTKLIVLSNPCNPTGVGLKDSEVQHLVSLCQERGIFLLVDEEYFTDYQRSLIHQLQNCAVVSSLSKVYGFPGLRFGWFISQPELLEELVNYKRYVTVSNSSLCEYLSLEVLKQRDKHIAHYQQLLVEGEAVLKVWADRHADFLQWHDPQGTPFAYLTFNNDHSSAEFANQLLINAQVLVMPAEVFAGEDRGIRVSYGRPIPVLQKGLGKISATINHYSPKVL